MSQSWKTLAALALVTGALSISACNTIQGAGEDVSAAGSAVTNAAEETEDELTDDNPNTP
ncbi:MAG: entericidin A/B family lipoprotein [Hyphomonadaceae bacterium]